MQERTRSQRSVRVLPAAAAMRLAVSGALTQVLASRATTRLDGGAGSSAEKICSIHRNSTTGWVDVVDALRPLVRVRHGEVQG